MPPSSTDKSRSKSTDWFAAYSADHQHPVNQLLHQWCVPLILWSLVALLYVIPLDVSGMQADSQGSVAFLASVLAMVFWFGVLPRRLAWSMALVMLLALSSSAVLLAMVGTRMMLAIALAVFVLAWVGQFIGHHIEGKRPSFLTDLVYLLIGPPWVLIKLFRLKSPVGDGESIK
jgi:uncharacterized membrane protein YGL010W